MIRCYIFIDAYLREELEQLKFSQRSQAKQGMVKRKDLLDRDVSARWLVESCCHGSISTFPEGMQDLIIRTCIKQSGPMVSTGDPWCHSPVSNLGIDFWLLDFSTGGTKVMFRRQAMWIRDRKG